MKKIIFLGLILACSVATFATTLPDAPDKILKIFHRDFPNVQNQSISMVGDSYMVYFKK